MNKLHLYNRENIAQAKFPGTEDGEYAKRYLVPIVEQGPGFYIDNVFGEMTVLIIDERYVLPVFVPEINDCNSYVASFYSHYISYCAEELKELGNKWLEAAGKLLLKAIGVYFRAARTDRCVQVNNWLLSTNLYADIPVGLVAEITVFLKHRYRGYAIAWMSVNQEITSDLYCELKRQNYLFLPSRSIYIFKHEHKIKKVRETLKKDIKLKEESRFMISETAGIPHVSSVLSLYRQLYIEKYSIYNPQFNEHFMALLIKKQLVNFSLILDEGNVVGMSAYYKRNRVMTTPLLGYAGHYPQEDGLYRILSVDLIEKARKEDLILHQSAGAGNFKRWRGSSNDYEYRVLDVSGIPKLQRSAYYLLKLVLETIAVPLMKRKKL